MDEEYFRTVTATIVTTDDLDRKGYAVWDRYIKPRFRRHDFGFEIANGELELRIKQGYATALVVFPAAMKAEYDKAVEELENIRQDFFVETWAEFMPQPKEETAFVPTDEDRVRGYVPFARTWTRRTQHTARPQPDEVSPSLAMFATPGEYEPVTFSIWPLRDLKDVKIEVSNLRNENGDVLPGEAFRVWFLQHRQERRSRPATAYKINSAYLSDWGVRTLYKDIATRCWLNAKLPADARPGIYTGAVMIRPAGGTATRIPLTLRMLSFKLIRPDALHNLRYASNQLIIPYPSRYPLQPGDYRNQHFYREQTVLDLQAHGFLPEFSAWWPSYMWREGDRLVIDWDRDDGLLGPMINLMHAISDLAPLPKKHLWMDVVSIGGRYILPAFAGKPKGGMTVEYLAKWLDEVEKVVAGMGSEKIYIAAFGEESHSCRPGKGFEEFLAWLRFVREGRKSGRWPHLYTAHSSNTPWGPPKILPECDLTALGMFHGSGLDGEAQIDIAKRSGALYGTYGTRGRHVAGFYHWRSGSFTTYHEFYSPHDGTPNNDWDNRMGMDSNARQVMNEVPGWCIAAYSHRGRQAGRGAVPGGRAGSAVLRIPTGAPGDRDQDDRARPHARRHALCRRHLLRSADEGPQDHGNQGGREYLGG